MQITSLTGGVISNNDFREDLEVDVDFPFDVFASGFPGVSPAGSPWLLFSLREDITTRKN